MPENDNVDGWGCDTMHYTVNALFSLSLHPVDRQAHRSVVHFAMAWAECVYAPQRPPRPDGASLRRSHYCSTSHSSKLGSAHQCYCLGLAKSSHESWPKTRSLSLLHPFTHSLTHPPTHPSVQSLPTPHVRGQTNTHCFLSNKPPRRWGERRCHLLVIGLGSER